MSLGLPPHLSARATSSAFLRALHAIGLTCLAAAVVAAGVFQAKMPDEILWPAMIAVVPMGILLWLHGRTRSLFFALSFLFIGGACTYWYIVTFYSQTQPIMSSDAFSIDFPKLALMMVGGPGVGLLIRFAWCAVGFLFGEIAAGAALVQTGNPLQFDATTFLAFGAISVVLLLTWAGRRRVRRAQPLLHRAVRDEHLASERLSIEAKAAALMHDTVLSDLAAIASASDGRLNPQLRQQVEKDLETLIGREWLDDAPGLDPQATQDWNDSTLNAAISEVRVLGLEIEPTGDLGCVSRLSREASVALGLAVKQCLVNVLRHSGTLRAEVVAYGADDEVSVMVIDAGRGFSEGEAGSDRLGLRNSVRRRMESVGGTVQVWSTPGRGTSIVIRVPASARGSVTS
ncbi:MAG: ATP-binding protein [Microbacteriaceae bacterium]|nr:ATP-binding protein [Microbacteriaceae bacterium]